MFARTKRLLLRPGFAEDAPALAALVAEERRLRVAPADWSATGWPFSLATAEELLDRGHDPVLPMLLIIERTAQGPRLVGAGGLRRRPSGNVELLIWIGREQSGRGLAGEACAALVAMARAIGLTRLDARCVDGDVASEQLLKRLGFVATGVSAPMERCASGATFDARVLRAELTASRSGARLAA